MPGGYDVDEPLNFFGRSDRAHDPDTMMNPTNDVHYAVEVGQVDPTYIGHYVVRIYHGDKFEYAEGAPFRYVGDDTRDCILALIRSGTIPGAAQYASPDDVVSGYASGDANVKTLTYRIPCYNPACGQEWHCVVTFAFLTIYEGD